MKFGRFSCQLRSFSPPCQMDFGATLFVFVVFIFRPTFDAASSWSANEEINKQNKRPVFCFLVWIDEQISNSTQLNSGQAGKVYLLNITEIFLHSNKKKHQDNNRLDPRLRHTFFIWCKPQIDSIPQKERKGKKIPHIRVWNVRSFRNQPLKKTNNNNKVKTAEATKWCVSEKRSGSMKIYCTKWN